MIPNMCRQCRDIIKHELCLSKTTKGIDFVRQATQWREGSKGYSMFHQYHDLNSVNIFHEGQVVSNQSHKLRILIAIFFGRCPTLQVQT